MVSIAFDGRRKQYPQTGHVLMADKNLPFLLPNALNGNYFVFAIVDLSKKKIIGQSIVNDESFFMLSELN